jgi:hypothetical protein
VRDRHHRRLRDARHLGEGGLHRRRALDGRRLLHRWARAVACPWGASAEEPAVPFSCATAHPTLTTAARAMPPATYFRDGPLLLLRLLFLLPSSTSPEESGRAVADAPPGNVRYLSPWRRALFPRMCGGGGRGGV